MLFRGMSVKDFVDKLASKEAVPGGGSAAAMTGAMAAGLCLMVMEARIKSNRKIDEDYKKLLIKFHETVLRVKNDLVELIDRDAKSYESVMQALKLPHKSETEKNAWFKAKNRAYKDATLVPLAIFCYSCNLECISDRLLDWCSTGITPIISGNYLSDIKTANYLAKAARDSALAVIKINLSEIADEEHFIEIVKNEISEAILF